MHLPNTVRKLSSAMVLVLAVSSAANADQLLFRFSGDYLTDQTTTLHGNVGTSLLYRFDSGLSFGGTIYSAAFGDAGGLFIGGYEVGQQFEFADDLFIEGSVFFGGGGGATIVPGDGMLIRPRLMFGKKVGLYELSLGASYMHVTGSDIASPVIEFAVSHPLDLLFNQGHSSSCAGCIKTMSSDYVSLHAVKAVYKNYIPLTDKAPGNRDGSVIQTMQLAGAQFEFDMKAVWGEGWYSYLAAAGSMGGDGEGYAEFFAGGKYLTAENLLPSKNVRLFAEAGLGFAGGGDVDTGGGSMAAAHTGIQWGLFNGLTLDTGIGYVGALEGGYHAWVPSMKLGMDLGYSHSEMNINYSRTADLNPTHWTVSTGYSVIADHDTLRYASETGTGNIGMVDVKADIMFSENYYVTGQAYTVTSGGAGGFAMGLLGLGAAVDLNKNWRLSAEGLAGAAAGGAVDVEGGLVVSGQMDLDYRLTDNLSLSTNAGWIKAVKGGLNGPMVGLGLKFDFTTYD
ncbi:hypothetical protein [Psychromonas ossibalaenae]|uniref:hypothetical protein n=1 Tax=Psychromonas ossibalaenae TaxID=444922 RepID=UPI0012F85423|nr:hypothetical protein [Psychromonas ossibalaenae]